MKGWPAPAKLNLFLHVVGRRGDGYHELQTTYQTINLHDDITFELNAGERIELGALEPSRDFTYISDTVEGLIAAANSNGLDGQIFNLGFGQDISIGSLVDKISSIIGKKLQIQTKSHLIRPKEGEVMRLCSDNSLIASQTNWQPKVPLYEGLAMTIDWFRENSAGNAVSRTFR